MYSRQNVIAMILKTLDYDRSRGGHTVESLIRMLRVQGVISSLAGVRTYPFPSIVHTAWTENDFRVLIAELIQSGRIDMRSNGSLLLGSESEDTQIEKYQGAWYATVNGSIKGPFNSEGEATRAVNSLCATDRQGARVDSTTGSGRTAGQRGQTR